MASLKIIPKLTTVGEAKIGLLMLTKSRELIVKSEYRSNGTCDCTIVSSGENYCGGDDQECMEVVTPDLSEEKYLVFAIEDEFEGHAPMHFDLRDPEMLVNYLDDNIERNTEYRFTLKEMTQAELDELE